MTSSKEIATGKLSDIMKAEANIAMPEVVSIFLSKHETDLYNQKTTLQGEITDLKKDLEMHEAKVAKAANFKQYVDIKIPKLNLITALEGSPMVDWANETVGHTVNFHNTDEKDNPWNKATGFNKVFTKPISQKHLEDYRNMVTLLSTTEGELSRTISKIGDMPRKERQIKARISELRLQEQGLEHFIEDAEMQKLISIN